MLLEFFQKYSLKKIVAVFTLVVVAVVCVNILYSYLSFGKIIVKTNDEQNIIRIQNIESEDNSASALDKEQVQGDKLTKKVKAGNYQVYVSNKSGRYGVTKTVVVKARQSIVLNLNPGKAIINPEPVYGHRATDVVADQASLTFFDRTDNRIKRATGSGFVSPFPTYLFSKIVWMSPGVGVGQTADNRLYSLRGDSATTISLPFDTNQLTDFSISNNGVLYLSKGKDVYSGVIGGQYQKIYTAKLTNLKLFAGNKGVAVVEIEGNGIKSSALAIVLEGSKPVRKNINVRDVAWSPNGSRFITNSGGQNIVFDGSLKQIETFPAPQSSSFTWQDESSLFYSMRNQLWLRNIKAKSSRQVTAIGVGQDLSGLYLDSGKSYVYLSGDADDSKLFRVAINGQNGDQSFVALSAFLPETIGICMFNYINFIKPTMLISFDGSYSYPENCIKAGSKELKYYDLDSTKFQYTVIPVTNSSY